MEPAKLTWSGGVPVAERFDDPYFAKSDGLAETRHTYGQAGVLRYVSFEAFTMSADDMERALTPFGAVAQEAAALVRFVASGAARFAQDGFELEILHGDARATVPLWQGAADAWYLDGFSPAKNPELWEADLMEAVAQKTNRGGTFATYSAAGHVRRKLESAGFTVTRSKGFGTKRHMSRGVLG